MTKFKINENKEGYYFSIHGNNNKLVMRSELYNSKDACQNGINTVKAVAALAEIDDQTKEM